MWQLVYRCGCGREQWNTVELSRILPVVQQAATTFLLLVESRYAVSKNFLYQPTNQPLKPLLMIPSYCPELETVSPSDAWVCIVHNSG